MDPALIRKVLPGETLIVANASYASAAPDVLVGDVNDPANQQALQSAIGEGRRICVLIDAHLGKGGDIPSLQAALQLGGPVVPICFDGPWSNRYKQGPEDYLLPRRGALPVSLSIGMPTDAAGFHKALLELEAEVWLARKGDEQAFIAATLKVAGDPSLRREMASSARASVLDADWERIARRLVAVMEEVLQRHEARAGLVGAGAL